VVIVISSFSLCLHILLFSFHLIYNKNLVKFDHKINSHFIKGFNHKIIDEFFKIQLSKNFKKLIYNGFIDEVLRRSIINQLKKSLLDYQLILL